MQRGVERRVLGGVVTKATKFQELVRNPSTDTVAITDDSKKKSSVDI
jgi:hypothetical protein